MSVGCYKILVEIKQTNKHEAYPILLKIFKGNIYNSQYTKVSLALVKQVLVSLYTAVVPCISLLSF